MEITAMGWWHPPSGTALRWRPTRHCAQAAEATPAGPGATTFLAENHVRSAHLARSRGDAHRAYLGSGTEVDGELDAAAMTRALHTFVSRHPILRTWFDTDGSTVRTHVVAPEDIAFDVEDLGHIESGEQFSDHLRQRFESEAVSDSFPGFAFGVISRPGGFAIFLGCDHALSDGASQALALSEIIELYAASVGVDAEPCPAAPAVDGHGDYAVIEHELAAQCAAGTDETTEWRETFIRNGLRMPGFPLDLGLAPGETAPVRPLEMTMLDRDGIAAFDSACRSAGGSVVSGIYAALAITGRELAGLTTYYGMTVLNTRAMLPRFATSQGWFCSFAPVEIDTTGATRFSDLMAASRAAQQRAKRLAMVPVQSVLAEMISAGASMDAVVSAPNLLSYIDFRKFPADGTPAYDRGVIFTGEGRTANASTWINRDHDRLYLGSQTPDTRFAQAQVNRYYARLCAVVAAVAADGDHVITSPPAPARIPIHDHDLPTAVSQERALARHHH
jgi:hypothetical protein